MKKFISVSFFNLCFRVSGESTRKQLQLVCSVAFCAFENLVILELLKKLVHRVCPRSEGFDPQTISFTFYFADHRAYLDDTRLGLETCDRANTKQVYVGGLEVHSFFLNSITSCQSLFTLRGKTFGLGALIKNKKRL